MNYTQLSDTQVEHMLKTIGTGSVEELFSRIPRQQRLDHPLEIPAGVSEMELLADLRSLAGRNKTCDDLVCFLGAGAYDHFIPTIVDHLAMRGEFRTAYTPYQAEASQGALQAFYEYQTMICRLTGMKVANASLYEQTTAVAEAVLMASAITRRTSVVISGVTHPETRAVLRTYLGERDFGQVEVGCREGTTHLGTLKSAVGQSTAAVVVQWPNFLGHLEPLDEIIKIAHDAGALAVVCADPIACALLKPPGDYGADIVVGEGQALGIPLSYGGPYLGFFACREKFLRKMPGRVVSEARDVDGRRSFCLVLQTREQHIRREKATSNVCTNQGLMALRAAVHLAAMGKQGLAEAAAQCLDKSHYAAGRIAGLDGFQLRFAAPFFKEFVVQTDRDVEQVLKHCRTRNILAGVPLHQWYQDMKDCFVVAVTEKRTRKEIDALVDALGELN
ncbi:MAG: aminomethyl-transferring glycine dehydrogenase subunit GcvPA [Phycisphaerae bacterium]|nr:aminomethyl-transferring glycine dehydrogenase subunit GcvPA [Phycisphaerae bacterium]